MATHHRTCPLCEAMCGLEIETEGLRATRVRGARGGRFGLTAVGRPGPAARRSTTRSEDRGQKCTHAVDY